MLFIALTTQAQDMKECHGGWGKWSTLYNFAPGVDFKIAFNFLIRSKAGSFSCQESYYKISNDYLLKGAYIKFKLNYRDTKGQVQTRDMQISLDKTGVLFDNTADWFGGYELVGPIEAYFVNPQKDKAKKLETDVNAALYNTINKLMPWYQC